MTSDHKLGAAALQESELQQLTELHSQLQRYHTQSSCQEAALASIASAAAGALRQLQPSPSLTSSADSGSAQQTLNPKPQVDLSLALAASATEGAGPVERPEDAQALMQQLLAAVSEAQHTAAERQRALSQQVCQPCEVAGCTLPCTSFVRLGCASVYVHQSCLPWGLDVCQAASVWRLRRVKLLAAPHTAGRLCS